MSHINTPGVLAEIVQRTGVDMKREQSRAWMLMAALVLLAALIAGKEFWRAFRYESRQVLQEYTEKMYMPGVAYQRADETRSSKDWFREKALSWLPLVKYVSDRENLEQEVEDEETLAKILEKQANDESVVDADGNLVGESKTAEVPANLGESKSSIDMSIERLRDFDYLLSNFYTVDSSTMIGPEQLNADDLLGRSMKIDRKQKGPKILIFHTHSQEEFADSIPGDPSTSIVGIGDYLTELLNQKGIETIHDKGVYDIINGQLDRSNAYEYAEEGVRPILEANPTIEVAIDLHRDGVAEGTHLVTEVNGKPTAKIMYFNGLSRTRANGDITYLPNPYIQDNLAFSLQMELASERMFPGFARHIYLRAYRYNLHLLPKSLLIEAGAQTNTVQEMKNAMEVLAETLCQVIG